VLIGSDQLKNFEGFSVSSTISPRLTRHFGCRRSRFNLIIQSDVKKPGLQLWARTIGSDEKVDCFPSERDNNG
jgi:hypothetical protein